MQYSGRASILISLVIALVSCGDSIKNEKIQSNTPTNTQAIPIEADHVKTPTISKSILDSIKLTVNDNSAFMGLLSSLGYVAKYNGIYTTTDSDKNGKPSSWITVTILNSESSMISYKTSKSLVFSKLKQEIEASTNVDKEQTNFFTKCHGDRYTYALYAPEKDVNTVLNEYYEIVIYPIGTF